MIGQFLNTLNDNWFSSLILFVFVIGIVVDTLIMIRGTR